MHRGDRQSWPRGSRSACRIFVIEELAWDADGDLDLDVQHQRGNFYDRETAPFPIE